MHPYQQHEAYGDGRQKRMSFPGAVAALVRGLAISVEVFLHDPDTFGSRYLKRQAGNVLALLFIQALFWHRHNPDGLIIFGLVFLFRWLCVLGRVAKRVKQGGPEPHSGYTGTPLLMRLFPTATELRIKEGYEPWLVCIVAVGVMTLNPPLGFYLFYAGFGLGISVTMGRVYQRERAIDLNDAYLEQRGVVEQFRDMRGD